MNTNEKMGLSGLVGTVLAALIWALVHTGPIVEMNVASPIVTVGPNEITSGVVEEPLPPPPRQQPQTIIIEVPCGCRAVRS